MRKIGLIAFDITRKCTLHCLHCYNHSGENQTWTELTDCELDCILKDLVSVEPDSFCICGGEPLLRKDRALQFVKETKKRYLNMDINMVSNGELLTEDVIKEIITSNLSSLQLSMDGACSKTHDWIRKKTGIFDKVVNAIRYMDYYRKEYQKDFLISVAFCPTKENIDEIDQAIQLCEDLHVDLFRVQPLMLIGRAEENLKEKMLERSEYSRLSRKLNKKRQENAISSQMIIDWIDPLDHITIDDSNEINFIQVDASGNLLLSPYIPIAVGNLKNHSIHEYLNHNYQRIWEHKLFHLMRRYLRVPEKMSLSKVSTIIPSIGKGVISFDVLEEGCNEKMDKFYKQLIKE